MNGVEFVPFSRAAELKADPKINMTLFPSGKIVYLGSSQGGSYTASTLGVGANNTYYLGTGFVTGNNNSAVLNINSHPA